jgi:deazaflavin-dependent oxidoreductase (nitroreductase family)
MVCSDLAVDLGTSVVPLVVLHSSGARTGRRRRTPVIRIERDGSYLAVASKGAAARNPAWCHNVRANPRIQVRDGTAVKEFQAREITGAERPQWWNHAVELWPAHTEYQSKTNRVIPVFVLEPVSWKRENLSPRAGELTGGRPAAALMGRRDDPAASGRAGPGRAG